MASGSPTNAEVLDTLFSRGIAGASDQTNCCFAPRIAKMGSHASQLAKSFCIFCSWQFLYWYDLPPSTKGVGSVIQETPELDFYKR